MGATHETSLNEFQETEVIATLEANKKVNNLDINGRSIYRSALECGLVNLVKYCHGIHAEIIPPLPDSQSILHFAILCNQNSLVKTILREQQSFGPLLNHLDSRGRTPLHYAVLQDNPEIVATLLKYTSNMSPDFTGKTPSDCLWNSPNKKEIIELLHTATIIISTGFHSNTSTGTTSKDCPLLDKHTFISALPIIRYDELEILEEISTGSTCVLYRGAWRGCEVAIKQFKQECTSSPKAVNKFLKESCALMKVRHPNLLMIMGVCMEQPCIVSEYVPNVSLFRVIHGKGLLAYHQKVGIGV